MKKEEALAIVDRVIVAAEGSWDLKLYGRVVVKSGYCELQFVCLLGRHGVFSLDAPITYKTTAEHSDRIVTMLMEYVKRLAAQRDMRVGYATLPVEQVVRYDGSN